MAEKSKSKVKGRSGMSHDLENRLIYKKADKLHGLKRRVLGPFVAKVLVRHKFDDLLRVSTDEETINEETIRPDDISILGTPLKANNNNVRESVSEAFMSESDEEWGKAKNVKRRKDAKGVAVPSATEDSEQEEGDNDEEEESAKKINNRNNNNKPTKRQREVKKKNRK